MSYKLSAEYYKLQALRDAYRGRSSMLAWNLCVVAGRRLIG